MPVDCRKEIAVSVAVASKKYKFEDLSLGMTVRQSEISDIFDKDIILINSRLLPNNDAEGEVAYLAGNGDETDISEYEKWFDQTEIPITPIYQSEDISGRADCDE